MIPTKANAVHYGKEKTIVADGMLYFRVIENLMEVRRWLRLHGHLKQVKTPTPKEGLPFSHQGTKPPGKPPRPIIEGAHPEATPAIREAIRLRYRMMPYLYSLMHAATRGEAVLRPTFVAFPEDELCTEDSLMLGPFLLATPVVSPSERVRRSICRADPLGGSISGPKRSLREALRRRSRRRSIDCLLSFRRARSCQ
jgi:hypothetical protein